MNPLCLICSAFLLIAAAPPQSTSTSQPIPTPSIPTVSTPTVAPQTQPKGATGQPKGATGKKPMPFKFSATGATAGPEQQVGAIYTSPGIATIQGGDWVGAEHLYGLSTDIRLVVEIVHPQGMTAPITKEWILEKVQPILIGGGVQPRSGLSPNQTPLPFLHFLVMINPIEKGYVAYCAARLFESVQVDRPNLKVDVTWQAITWEKQELMVFASEQLEIELAKAVEASATSFANKFKSYERQK